MCKQSIHWLEKAYKNVIMTAFGSTSTGQVSGIFIKKIAEGSAADRNGQVQVNDQIVEVKNIP